MKILPFLFLLPFTLLINAQVPFIKYDSDDGFLSNMIYDIEEDSKGFLWIITDKGVIKYSGNSFQTITIKNGLQSNDNYKMIIDKNDDVWVYSNKEVAKINSHLKVKHMLSTNGYYGSFVIDDKLETIHMPLKTSNLSWKHILLRKDSVIEVTNHLDISELIYKSKKFKMHGFCFYRKNNFYNYVYDSKTSKYFYQQKLVGNRYQKESQPSLNLGLFSIGNNHLYKINDSLELLTGLEEYKLLRYGEVIEFGKWPDNALKISTNNILILDDIAYIPLNKGVYTFKMTMDKFEFKGILSNVKNCTSILKDREGCIWISTLGNGLLKIPQLNLKMYHFNPTQNELVYRLGGKSLKNVWGITRDRVINLSNPNEFIIPEGLTDGRSILYDSKKLFFGGSSTFYVNQHKLVKNNYPVKDLSINKGKIAIAFFNGVLISRISNLRFKKSPIGDVLVDIPIKPNSVLLTDSFAYVATNNGLYAQKLNGGFVEKLKLDKIKSLGDSQISIIRKNSSNLLWVVSVESGVYLLHNNAIIKQFKKELLDSDIHSLKVDEKDNVWIATKKGINKIFWDGQKYKVTYFTSFHGLPSDYVFDTYCYNDTLYAATNQGLAVLDVCAIENENMGIPPLIYVQEAQLLGEKGAVTLPMDSTLSLRNDQNDISIQYTGISYRSNGNVRYEYRLVPAFENWRSTTNDNVTFNNLPSGKYTFEVRVINAIGTISTEPATYKFTIQKHYTETLWFRASAIVVLMSLIGAGFYLLFNYKRRKQEERFNYQKQISELRLRSLQAQLNPHFIFNSLNAIQQFINVENKKAANDYLSRFARLMRLYLTGSDNQFITLEEEMSVITLYCSLEHLRFSDKFTYTIDIEPGIDLRTYNVPAMLLQPHVENAIRHGLVPAEKDDNKLLIKVSKKDQGVLCTVEDNGIGRKVSNDLKMKSGNLHRSMGNKISKERLDLIRSLHLAHIQESIIDLEDEGGNVTGTRVEIYVTKSSRS